MRSDVELAEGILQRADALAACSEEAGRITRVVYSPAMRLANDLVAGWMREAGLSVREDAAGNLLGRYDARQPGAKTLLIGSHLDSVRDAGRYDGPLGVLVAIACIQRLHDAGERLPFAIEVVGFCDEEGVRFQTTYLGSRALAGTLTAADLARVDAQGVSIAEAMRRFGGNPEHLDLARREVHELIGYIEVHTEQGPVLDRMALPVGVVTGIVGQTRATLTFAGRAGHAGTTPPSLRQDALAGAAHVILLVETLMRREPGLLATVGQIEIQPGASNVIPGLARLTVDLRHADNAVREHFMELLAAGARHMARQRRLEVKHEIVQSTSSIGCAPEFISLLKQAAQSHVPQVVELPSGAGHDAAALAALTPVGMLFVRCKDGLSHHPDESVQAEDVAVAVGVLSDFLRLVK